MDSKRTHESYDFLQLAYHYNTHCCRQLPSIESWLQNRTTTVPIMYIYKSTIVCPGRVLFSVDFRRVPSGGWEVGGRVTTAGPAGMVSVFFFFFGDELAGRSTDVRRTLEEQITHTRARDKFHDGREKKQRSDSEWCYRYIM